MLRKIKAVLLGLGLAGLSFTQNPQSAIYPSDIATDNNLYVASNSASTTFSAPVGISDTTLNITSSTTFTIPTIILAGTELIAVCAKTSSTFTVCSSGRGYDSTTAATHSSGDRASGAIASRFFNQLAAEVKAIETNAVNTTLSYSNPAWITAFSATKLTGTVPCAQLPVFVGDMTSAGNTCNTLNVKINGVLLSSLGTGLYKFIAGVPSLATRGTDYALSDADLVTSDVTNNNSSTSKHGFVPKLPNDSTKFYNGVGGYTVPASTTVDATGLKAAVYVTIASGSPTAYSGSAGQCPASLLVHQTYQFTPDITNSGTTPSFNPCGFGAKTIVHLHGEAMIASELDTSQVCEVMYDGTSFALTDGRCLTGQSQTILRCGGALTSGPGTSGDEYLFCNSADGSVYLITSSNIVIPIGPSTYDALTDGATITWAIGGSRLRNAKLLFTAHGGSRTLNVTGLVDGGTYLLRIKQDGTGTEGLTLGTGCTWLVSGGGAGAITPTVTANAIDILAFTYDGTNCYANFNKNFN